MTCEKRLAKFFFGLFCGRNISVPVDWIFDPTVGKREQHQDLQAQKNSAGDAQNLHPLGVLPSKKSLFCIFWHSFTGSPRKPWAPNLGILLLHAIEANWNFWGQIQARLYQSQTAGMVQNVWPKLFGYRKNFFTHQKKYCVILHLILNKSWSFSTKSNELGPRYGGFTANFRNFQKKSHFFVFVFWAPRPVKWWSDSAKYLKMKVFHRRTNLCKKFHPRGSNSPRKIQKIEKCPLFEKMFVAPLGPTWSEYRTK